MRALTLSPPRRFMNPLQIAPNLKHVA
jgi:hypothetical protein